jgi:hypothetical protein
MTIEPAAALHSHRRSERERVADLIEGPEGGERSGVGDAVDDTTTGDGGKSHPADSIRRT